MARPRKKSFKIPGASFSWKRATGISRAKQQFARRTGIPTTKAGLQRRIGKTVMGGGCLLPTILVLIVIGLVVSFI